MIKSIEPRWTGLDCIVAATGPSLTEDVAEACRSAHEAGAFKVIAVNDAYLRLPFADVLYACDKRWWNHHKGCPGFFGEKWSSHEHPGNDKLAPAKDYGLSLVAGTNGEGFSLDSSLIHYGNSSGYQAINLALLFGVSRIVLVGFDMHVRDGRHFFGNHPKGLSNGGKFEDWVPLFKRAAKTVPDGTEIINCTPGSALKCFPFVDLGEALAG